ncbi:hypothetical protein Xish_01794 [Xenorhabdus ishibashii]|uniref:Uncharacterized protein n=1 Tax=Xenorhabdus ishibashii TaxID=1034471 RepID=A0A2D0KGY9_9GAMM|nr:hypothetical protein Xish_01794 [Xenorhabdus ishibashii]
MHAAWQNAATTSNAKMLLFYTLWLQSEINVRCITLEGGIESSQLSNIFIGTPVGALNSTIIVQWWGHHSLF